MHFKSLAYNYRYLLVSLIAIGIGLAIVGCVPETYCVRASRIAHERWEDRGYPVRYIIGWRSEIDFKRYCSGLTKDKHRWCEVLIDGKWFVLDDGKPPRGTAKEMGYAG